MRRKGAFIPFAVRPGAGEFMAAEQLILVDERDRELGVGERSRCR
jgi:hypothetical protein